MCDAFQKQGEIQLILPHIKSNFKLNKIKRFSVNTKKKFTVKGILKYKVKILNRIYFGYKSTKYIKKTNSNIVLTRSIIAVFFYACSK